MAIYLINKKPFKKERDGSATSGSAFGSTSGGGIFSFSVKSLISGGVGRRKKSAPEQELKRCGYEAAAAAAATTTGDDLDQSGNDGDHIPSEYLSRMSQIHLTSSSTIHTYYIYLNESCCVEVSATQQASTVHNLLAQALRKIKASEDYSEYCLVEHIELEQMLPSPSKETPADLINGTTAAVNSTTTTSTTTTGSSSNMAAQLATTSTTTTTSGVVTSSPATTTTTSLGNITGSSNMLSMIGGVSSSGVSSSGTSQQPSHHGKKKLTVKSRILGASENLFVLTHVWNQMKLEGRDGFKFAKVILTKRRALPKLHQLSLKKRKQAILAQHRMSLQPKPTTTTTTTTTSSARKTTTTTTTTTSSTNVITNNKNGGGTGSGVSSRKSSVIASEIAAIPTAVAVAPVAVTAAAVVAHHYLSNGNGGTRVRPPPRRERSSLNRLVRQKSFEDSSECLNQIEGKKAAITTTTTST